MGGGEAGGWHLGRLALSVGCAPRRIFWLFWRVAGAACGAGVDLHRHGGHDLKMIRPLPTGWPGGGAFAFGCRAGGCGGAGGGAPWSEAVLSCSSGVSILNFFSVASSFTPTLPSRSVLKSSLASSVRSIALMTSPFL